MEASERNKALIALMQSFDAMGADIYSTMSEMRTT
jgi:hypothetical protein